MFIETQIEIRSNPNLYRYLRENSHWYKYLNRSPFYLKEVEAAMKSEYKLRPEDKMEKFSDRLDMITSIIDVFS